MFLPHDEQNLECCLIGALQLLQYWGFGSCRSWLCLLVPAVPLINMDMSIRIGNAISCPSKGMKMKSVKRPEVLKSCRRLIIMKKCGMMNKAMNPICEMIQMFSKRSIPEIYWKKAPRGIYKATKISHPRTYCCRLILPLEVKNNRMGSKRLVFLVTGSSIVLQQCYVKLLAMANRFL